MSRKKTENTESAPTRTPTRQPIRAPKSKSSAKAASKPEPNTTAMPIRKSTATRMTSPTVTSNQPELPLIFVYTLRDFEKQRTVHPNYFGEKHGEFVTPSDAKQYLTDHELRGWFAFVERLKGKIGRSWPVEIEPNDEEPSFDEDLTNDLGFLDEDDVDELGEDGQTLSPALVRLKIQNAKLQAKVESQGGPHSSMLETVQALKMFDEIRKPEQQQSLIAKAREIEELRSLLAPKVSPATPAQPPPLTPEVSVAAMLMKDPDVVKSVVKNLVGDKGDGESASTTITLALIKEIGQPVGELLGAITARLIQPLQGTGQMQAQQSPPQPTQEQANTAPEQQSTNPAPQANEGQSIEDQLLLSLLDQCNRRVPPKVAYARLCEVADRIDEEMPAQSIGAYFDLFATAEPEMVKAWLDATVPNAKQVTEQPHFLQWATELQAIVKANMSQEE